MDFDINNLSTIFYLIVALITVIFNIASLIFITRDNKKRADEHEKRLDKKNERLYALEKELEKLLTMKEADSRYVQITLFQETMKRIDENTTSIKSMVHKLMEVMNR